VGRRKEGYPVISDVIWHRLVRLREHLKEAELAYDNVDEPALIAAMEKVQELTGEVLQLARRKSNATGLRVVRPPKSDA
jgi:hypothetical protein